ncbi:MAG: DUF1441 family protein, partial [Gammaproteobacteria bacterium]|nr:DUF1441 family protein [Gammaproteobacteria bacterium]
MTVAVDIQTGGPLLPPVGVAVVARLFNLTERRIQQLAKQGILSKTAHGKYDLLTAVREYIAYLHDKQTTVSDDPDKLPPKDRLDWYRGTRERTRHLQEIGELIPAADYEAALASALKAVAAGLESLPDLLERDAALSGAAVERAIVVIDA